MREVRTGAGIRSGTQGAQPLVRPESHPRDAAQGQAKPDAPRSGVGHPKSRLTWEERWQIAVEAGAAIIMRRLREEGKRVA